MGRNTASYRYHRKFLSQVQAHERNNSTWHSKKVQHSDQALRKSDGPPTTTDRPPETTDRRPETTDRPPETTDRPPDSALLVEKKACVWMHRGFYTAVTNTLIGTAKRARHVKINIFDLFSSQNLTAAILSQQLPRD